MLKVEFEGTDGAGKTTGLKYFIEKAKSMGLSVVETREVGNPHIPACVKMREFVLDPKSGLDGASMELIFSAMRIENDVWEQKLANSPDAPDLLVSDRGWFSHLAYTDHNVSTKFTELLYNGFLGKITSQPDAVVYFDVNTDTALKRRVKRGETMDVIEMKGIPFQDLVRNSFEKYIVASRGIRIFTIDANQDLDGVKAQLNVILDSLL